MIPGKLGGHYNSPFTYRFGGLSVQFMIIFQKKIQIFLASLCLAFSPYFI